MENWSNTNSIVFYVNATDLFGANCTVYTNASGNWQSNATFNYNTNLMSASATQIFADGSYSWNATCSDTAQNTAQGTASVLNIDTITPNINFSHPTPDNNSYRNVTWTFINVSYTEPSNHSFVINFGGTNYTNADITAKTTHFYKNITGLPDGKYTYYAWINDSANNANQTETRNITIDTTTPAINWINATGYAKGVNLQNWSNTNTITFYINTTDLYGTNCTIYTNTTGSWTANATFNYNTNTMSNSATQIFTDGSYSWNATCNDTAQNTAQGTASILNIDASTPTITYSAGSIPDNTTTPLPHIFINFTFSEANNDTIVISLNGTNYTNGISCTGSSCSINITSITDGNYSYYAWINDSAGTAYQAQNKTITTKTN